MRKTIFAAVALMMSVGAAAATDLKGSSTYNADSPKSYNWTGVYVGGDLGYGLANHNLDLSASQGTNTADLFIDGFGSHGLFGGGTVGIDVAKGPFLFGVFGEYTVSDVKTEAGLSYNSTSFNASIKEGNSWYGAARVGYLFGDDKRALFYGFAGYGQTDVSYHVDGLGSKDLTFSGIVVGAGSEYALTSWATVGVKYEHFFGSKETIASGTIGNAAYSLTDDHDTDKVMMELKLKLTGSVFGY